MNKQDYIDELKSDGEDWIDDYFYESYDPDYDFSDVYPDMELSITGNDNGSYYCSTAKAQEAIAEAMWDEEVVNAVRDMGFDGIPTDKGPEAVDVIIRIALLGEVISELEDYFDENKPTIENVLDGMDYWIRSDKQPTINELKKWHEMLEKVQEVHDVQ